MTITQDFELDYNGYVFGSGTGGIELVSLEGIDDLPDISSHDYPRAEGDGIWPGADQSVQRTITGEYECWGETQ